MVLPADILLLICEELSAQHDFKTLFHCALTGKHLAGTALLCLYRIHDDYLRIISSEGTDIEWNKTQDASKQSQTGVERKWSLIWKSIVRSSLGTAAYPYALFIRSLDLNNLAELLDDTVFKASLMRDFFADEMQQFLGSQNISQRGRTKSQIVMNREVTVNLVGDSISKFIATSSTKQKTTIALESLSGNIESKLLASWAVGMKRLRTLSVWDGRSVNGDVAAVISRNCFHFDELSMFNCMVAESVGDSNLAAFLSGLRSNTLKSFTIQSSRGLGPNVLKALNDHALSLKALRLRGVGATALRNLSLLQNCVYLEVLEMENTDGDINLEATENDVYLDVMAWLKQCNHLQELSFIKVANAPEFVTAICLQDGIKLRSLKVVKYMLADNHRLHQAISNQNTLESLSLRADPESSARDDIDTLVSSICLLSKLQELDLLETSDFFNTPEIRRLAKHLPRLEKFMFAGLSVTNDVLPALAELHYLRDLNINAFTSFSVDGLLTYISKLQPTNYGLYLSVFYQNPEYPLSDQERSVIQESISAKVSGKFEYLLAKDPLASDSEESESD